jgi:hypothetical protein
VRFCPLLLRSLQEKGFRGVGKEPLTAENAEKSRRERKENRGERREIWFLVRRSSAKAQLVRGVDFVFCSLLLRGFSCVLSG